MIFVVDHYDDFVTVVESVGVPSAVFYKLDGSGNVVYASAVLKSGGGVFGPTNAGAQSEANFLTSFPDAIESVANVQLKGY